MKAIQLTWNECSKEYVRSVVVDVERVNSLLKMCEVRERLLTNVVLDRETASVIAEDYYEIIKELLIALLLVKGFKSSNHECLVAFFIYHFPSLEYEATILFELKNIRNRISYEGYFVDEVYVNRNRLEFTHIAELIRVEIEKERRV